LDVNDRTAFDSLDKIDKTNLLVLAVVAAVGDSIPLYPRLLAQIRRPEACSAVHESRPWLRPPTAQRYRRTSATLASLTESVATLRADASARRWPASATATVLASFSHGHSAGRRPRRHRHHGRRRARLTQTHPPPGAAVLGRTGQSR
jgi:hypothetical protein